MSKEQAAGSAEIGETRTYAEISQALKTGSPADDKTPDAGAGQAEDATVDTTEDVTEPDQSSKLEDDNEPQTLEEAKALILKERKERENAQSKIGTQGNELGEMRKRLAALEADKAVDAKKDEPEFKSFVEKFKTDKRYAGMTDATKEYMGFLFDDLEQQILRKVPKAPEIENLRQSAAAQDLQRLQDRWNTEAKELTETYEKPLVDKYGPQLTAEIEQMIKDGVHPSKISVTKVFKQLAFDDPELRSKPNVKDTLNDRAGKKRPGKVGNKQETTIDVRGLSEKAAFDAILEDRKKKGLPL